MTHILTHMYGDVLVQGTKAECDIALQALVNYGEREDKFEVVELEPHDVDDDGNVLHWNSDQEDYNLGEDEPILSLVKS